MRSPFAVAATLLGLSGAEAQGIEEIRLGVAQHNACVIECGNADKEDGPNMTGELVFASPGFLSFALKPRPLITASINTAGDTSYGGVGLLWNLDFAEDWSFEPSLAYVLHDGTVDNPFPQGDPAGAAYAEENLLLGSDDLFRVGLALNRDFGETWGLQLQYDHLSHGQILGNGRNQGMDNVGVRIYWRLQ
jgi:lipid A 3-O-deacylase